MPIPGRPIDRAWLARKTAGVELAAVAHDRWGLNDLLQVMDREGVFPSLRPHGQGFRDMTSSVTALEALVLSPTLRHGRNALRRWAVPTRLDVNPAGGRKLRKKRARQK